MKLIIKSLLFLIIAISCKNNNNVENKKQQILEQKFSELQWRDTVVDLGNIKKGISYPIVFYVKNIGKVPLIFEKIESTCGCTVIDKKINKPILPNDTASIYAHFKLNETIGQVQRKIYVLANTKQQFYVLRVKAHVVE